MSGEITKPEGVKTRFVPALLLLTLLSACAKGGGEPSELTRPTEPEITSDSATDPQPAADNAIEPPSDVSAVLPPLATGPVQGFLTVEERAGRRTLDAWFVPEQHVSDEIPQRLLSHDLSTGDECQPKVTADPESSFAGKRTRAAEAIELVAHNGLHARLDYFLTSGSVAYATEVRWLRKPMPDDTQLNLVGNPRFDNIASPMLSAVQPLELNLPSRPVLSSKQTLLDWNPSDHPNDRIVLTVWPSGRTRVTDALPTFTCTLDDDGRFALADAIADTEALKNSDYAFRMRRERRTEAQLDGMRWSIVQSSLATF